MNSCPYCGMTPLAGCATECPRCHSPLPGSGSETTDDGGTRLESITDIRRWLQQEQLAGRAHPPAAKQDKAVPFRPVHRPSMALLCVLDDGGDDGEWIRIRGNGLVVGRAEGDVRIPHDDSISARHFQIYRASIRGQLVWRVKDLGSTNGTFARVSDAVLKHGQEFLLGCHRFRFEETAQPGEATEAGGMPPQRPVTQKWQTLDASELHQNAPAIAHLAPDGPRKRVPLTNREQWLGTDASQCFFGVCEDPFASPVHARVFTDPQGRWHIEDAGSRNGTWVQFREITVRTTAELQAGEQRFLMKVLSRENQTAR